MMDVLLAAVVSLIALIVAVMRVASTDQEADSVLSVYMAELERQNALLSAFDDEIRLRQFAGVIARSGVSVEDFSFSHLVQRYDTPSVLEWQGEELEILTEWADGVTWDETEKVFQRKG